MPGDRPIKWAIEDSFPIVEINRLAVPERNAFKPIYQMHKWFARRASCVFRAILLGCLKPLPVDKDGKPTKSGAELIMDEFYKDHTHDPDTNGKVILDPFMGGGTTVVEALRLGCKVIGIDLNPVAWFIVKSEVEPVEIEQLRSAFGRLADRTVTWSGKPLKQTLLDLYKTTCPCCGNSDADTMYTFWVKSAVCTNPTCGKQVPLYSSYIIATKSPSIRYQQNVVCPKCAGSFDWELDPASLITDFSLTVVNTLDGAGSGRGNKRWTFAPREPVCCPWCRELVAVNLGSRLNAARKKVQLSVLLCPRCQAIWQYRGSLPSDVACPACGHEYKPRMGTLANDYDVVCSCGTRSSILPSLRALPEDLRLMFRPYAIEGYCAACAGVQEEPTAYQADLFDDDEHSGDGGDSDDPVFAERTADPTHRCLIRKNNGKFFKRITPADLRQYNDAQVQWERQRSVLPWPKQAVPFGYQTVVGNDLPGHGFTHWHRLFNPRQLLCLSSLLAAIDEEPNQCLKEMLLGGFFQALRNNCLLCFYNPVAGKLEPALSRKDFAPPKTCVENSVWGTRYGRGTYASIIERFVDGKQFCHTPSDRRYRGLDHRDRPIFADVVSGERIFGDDNNCRLEAGSIGGADHVGWGARCDMVVTDPPYADNVNYCEVANFFYVWLRLVLAKAYPLFAPDHCPAVDEIIAPKTEDRLDEDLRAQLKSNGGSLSLGNAGMLHFQRRLTAAFQRVSELLKDDGLLVFTFHHEADTAWESVLKAVLDAGFYIDASYPCESDAIKGGGMGAMKIAYDRILVCRKRRPSANLPTRSWAGIRQEIRRRARQEIELIEAGRYGNEPLSPGDVLIILVGKCLELYSRHYGQVLNHESWNVELHDALEAIRMEVDQLISRDQPLPSELADIDPVSYVYLVCLADKAFEIKGDELHKYTRGVIEPDELLKAGLIIKGRTGRGRFFKIKSPAERFAEIQKRLDQAGAAAQAALPGMEEAVADASDKLPFIDYAHFLIALVEGGENLRPWMERFRGKTPQIRAACEYLRTKQPRFADACGKILKFIEVTPLYG